MNARASTDLTTPETDPPSILPHRKRFQPYPMFYSLQARMVGFSSSNPMYSSTSPLGRPLTLCENLLPLITLLHKILDDIQGGKSSNWQTRWKMFKEVSEDVAVHQLRQELRQLYREVGADYSCTKLMPSARCANVAQSEALAAGVHVGEHVVFGDTHRDFAPP